MGGSPRILEPTRVLAGILFFALLQHPVQVQATQSVGLSWSASLDPTVMGYRAYYGGASRTYTNVLDVSAATSLTIPGLVEGSTYFFSATSYNILGLESDFSAEVSYTVPIQTLARLHIRRGLAGQVILTVTGAASHAYEVQASQTMATWTVLGTVRTGAVGAVDFTDTNAASFSKRYYRTRALP